MTVSTTLPLAKLVIQSQSSAQSCLPSPLCSSSSAITSNSAEEDSADIKMDYCSADSTAFPLSPNSPFSGATTTTANADDSSSALDCSDEGSEEITDDNTITCASKKKVSSSSNSSSGVRKCTYCGATSTPMWRHGPGEFTHLCNSCGVKWRRGKILSSGDNVHHLIKSAPKKSASSHSTTKSSSSSLSNDPPSVSNAASKKRKASVLFEEWGAKESHDAGWDLPRTRNGRSCARKLWGIQSSDVEIEEDSQAVDNTDTSRSSGNKARRSTTKSNAMEEQVEEPANVAISVSQHIPSSTTIHINDSDSDHNDDNDENNDNENDDNENNDNENDSNEIITATSHHQQLHHLTSEFAALLSKLDAPKTAVFASILASGFEPRIRSAYESGVEIEMSVLDISPFTWDALRAVM